MSLIDEMAGDAAGAKAEKASGKALLERVAKMVRVRNDAEQRVEEAEEALKKAKAALLKIETVDIPEMFREAGVEELTLEDGTKVKIADDINCGITEERREAAYAWLRGNGAAGLIKTSVIVEFPRDERAVKKADALTLAMIKRFGAENVAQKELVHWQTLKSFLKERIAAHAENPKKIPLPPYATFGVNEFAIAKFTKKKDAAGGAAKPKR